MVILHPLSDFIDCNFPLNGSSPSYYYEGCCPQTGELLRLPRTEKAEVIARGLMQYLDADNSYSREGKMYGILLVELPCGEQRILKAFSGLLNGLSVVEGWVLPIPGREEVALDETLTLAKLEAIKQEIIKLKQLPERQQYQKLSGEFEKQLQEMSDRHRNYKQQRHEKRQIFSERLTGEELTIALQELDEASRRDGIERRQLKRQRDRALKPFKQLIDAADVSIRELKQQRKELSRQLQAKMHAAYNLMNFLGKSQTLQKLMPSGLPTGTGDCCAPKLLHYAATHNLKPLAMAEFWWGESSVNGEKIQGEFYGACVERCQPLMGFLLSGLKPRSDLETEYRGNLNTRNPQNVEMQNFGNVRTRYSKDVETRYSKDVETRFSKDVETRYNSLWERCANASLQIIYEDEWLIAVNKPSGLLSVPGRYLNNQDSVLRRLSNLLPSSENLTAVHRLDMDTSGILLLAKDLHIYRQLSQQFQERQVYKVYEALLAGVVTTEEGIIELPLWGNPKNRPCQEVNWEYGKPSLTKFRLKKLEGNNTRIEFIPLTGRTHQLRVHAADPKGLGIPILGDRLYGKGYDAGASRLHLHARELGFEHPYLRERMQLKVETPF